VLGLLRNNSALPTLKWLLSYEAENEKDTRLLHEVAVRAIAALGTEEAAQLLLSIVKEKLAANRKDEFMDIVGNVAAERLALFKSEKVTKEIERLFDAYVLQAETPPIIGLSLLDGFARFQPGKRSALMAVEFCEKHACKGFYNLSVFFAQIFQLGKHNLNLTLYLLYLCNAPKLETRYPTGIDEIRKHLKETVRKSADEFTNLPSSASSNPEWFLWFLKTRDALPPQVLPKALDKNTVLLQLVTEARKAKNLTKDEKELLDKIEAEIAADTKNTTK
jgi:hypothetical protein